MVDVLIEKYKNDRKVLGGNWNRRHKKDAEAIIELNKLPYVVLKISSS